MSYDPEEAFGQHKIANYEHQGEMRWWTGTVTRTSTKYNDKENRRARTIILEPLYQVGNGLYNRWCELVLSPELAALNPAEGDHISFRAIHVERVLDVGDDEISLQEPNCYRRGAPPISDDSLPKKKWLKVSELAEILAIAPRTIRGWCRDEKIHATQRGTHWYIDRERLLKDPRFAVDFK